MKSRAASSSLTAVTGKTKDRIAAYGRGRICAAPGCSTVLSAYNPGPCCSVHDTFCTSPYKRRA
jgi:hypothetical protein